jgi:uncharacterized protein YcbK (DUF882 family)
MGDLSENFSSEEFKCQCGCGEKEMHPRIIEVLESIREYIQRPMRITSGRRCERHNSLFSGAQFSAHITGEAVDFYVGTSIDRFKIIHLLMNLGITRIGVAQNFIHFDVSKTLPQNVIWLY